MLRRSAHSGSGARVASFRRSSAAGPGWQAKLIWISVGVALTTLLLYVTWSVISMLFAASVFAYLLNPPVSALERRGVSRDAAIIAVAGGIAAMLALFLVWLVPSFASQIGELGQNIRPYIDNLATQIGPHIGEIEARLRIDLPVDFNELRARLPEYLAAISPDVRARIQAYLQSAAQGGLSVILSLLSISLLPLFTFYLLRDWPRLLRGAEGLVPGRWRSVAGVLASEIDARLMGFVRGQLTVAVCLGFIYTGGLLIAGIDLAVSVGLLSGALFLIPYVGTLVGLVLSCTLALLKFGFDWHVVACVVTYVVGQGLEGAVLTPSLVGDRVGLHPMVVMVALIVGGNLLGLGGLVLAVPITATLAVIGGFLLDHYRQSTLYRA